MTLYKFNHNNNAEILGYLKSFSEIISSICLPLKKYGINFFTYSRIYDNGHAIFLCNDDAWYDAKFQNDLFDEEGFITLPCIYSDQYTKTIFTGAPNSKIKILSYLFQMNFWNSIDLYKNRDNYKEVFHFASTCENVEIINFYINNFKILENFAEFFHLEVFELIEQNFDKINLKIKPSIQGVKLMTHDLHEKLSCQKSIMISFNGKEISLSKRQLECLLFNTKGKTSKEIARELSLSNRTVEEHFEVLRNKFSCATRRELIALVMDNQDIKDLL